MSRKGVWERLAEDALRSIEVKRKSLENVQERLTKLELEFSGLRSSAMSLAPAVGGDLNKEETRRTDLIVLQRELTLSQEQLENDIDSFDKAWNGLNSDEQLVLSKFFIFRTRNYIDDLCEQLFCEKTKVYQMKDEALFKFTMGMYGRY